MENEQVISHEQALAALLEGQPSDGSYRWAGILERYINQQQLLGALSERPTATFALAIEQLINRFSIENGSNTPDFILASLLMQILKTWELHTVERDRWWGNRSLLGVGGTDWGGVSVSEKTLLPGVDITKPRDLIGEALGRVPGMGDYRFEATSHLSVASKDARRAADENWSPPLEKPLDIPTGLLGAVNNLYCLHEKLGHPWITDEPTWPGAERMNLRRELVEEECTRELFGALRELESWLHERGLWRKTACATQRDYVEGPERNEFRRLMATVADGIVDSIYVLIGMGGEMGLDLSEVWRRVHAANLAKVGGPVREDGKSLKPPGWIAPDIESAIFKTP